MPIGLLVVIYLFVLYCVAMLVLWHCLRGQKQGSTPSTAVPFALREGQTIVGIGETTQGIDFYIGDSVRDENYYDL